MVYTLKWFQYTMRIHTIHALLESPYMASHATRTVCPSVSIFVDNSFVYLFLSGTLLSHRREDPQFRLLIQSYVSIGVEIYMLMSEERLYK